KGRGWQPARMPRRRAVPPMTLGPALRGGPTTPGSVRHALLRSRRRRARGALVSLLALALFVTSGVAWAYRDLDTNIESHDIEELLGEERPEPAPVDPEDPHAGQALNVVLIGTDDRSGGNSAIGGGTTPGMRSDTVIVAHVSADRE